MTMNEDSPFVLVIEDDADVAYLLKFLMDRIGYNVITAVDGRQASSIIDESPPPLLVLLDVMLPYIDGFQLLSQIKDNAHWNNVPIIMLTSKAQEVDIVRALNNGASDYIVKPFQPDELMARVRRFLNTAK
jgi:DNA-binding response OmpR family regulator